MSLFSFSTMEAATMTDLLRHELQDLYDAEHQILDVMPDMAEAASSPDLKKTLLDHLRETEQHIVRLEDAFSGLGWKAERHSCEGMKGLLKESAYVLQGKLRGSVRDAALIAAIQRVEHYEIAGYGCARTFARILGHDGVADLLQETLDEEAHADKLLTTVASDVNERAPAGTA